MSHRLRKKKHDEESAVSSGRKSVSRKNVAREKMVSGATSNVDHGICAKATEYQALRGKKYMRPRMVGLARSIIMQPCYT